MCLFHKWGKWEQYQTTEIVSPYNIPCKQEKIMQKTSCVKCGYARHEWVANVNFVSLTKSYLMAGKDENNTTTES